MFIPYNPTEMQPDKSRRPVHALVAARAAQRRQQHQSPRFQRALGTFVVDPEDPESKDDPHKDRRRWAVQCKPGRTLPSPSPIGTGRFYPLATPASKGPCTARALSYYFDVLLPHDSQVLSHAPAQRQTYGSVFLHWSAHHDIILHGLAVFALCNLESQSEDLSPASAKLHAAALYHRARLLTEIQHTLATGHVTDLLISALTLLITVDDYLANVAYSRAHTAGFEAVIRARGGESQVGSSVPAISQDLRMAANVARSLLVLHMQTSLSPDEKESPSPPRAYPPTLDTYILNQTLDIPKGFSTLLKQGRITPASLEILASFHDWHDRYLLVDDPSNIPVWRHSASHPLNRVEKCIFVALLCLADDVSHMGLHPAAVIFRQPRKRAEMLLAVPQLWTDDGLKDCLVWLWMVITTPRNRGLTPVRVQRGLWERILREVRGDLHTWGKVERVLRGFVFDGRRAGVWEETFERLRGL
ncbi:hypothetical protein ASPACDRAFT_49652 [Aspergillus aculeatus ATCC 16872]|uniref:Transcription factor domain-containing protein n=1 Tax=Aspergillus aculeatus (strain ATCC 16872 / CBS 172.66 / WB 5094) TaxID=690307 RepID=A0A1L9X584_ASPA1|nr:uncharacterized protein ASPACDRAFT_49652 [Aspergillus aculeatus ATCC 16872]OJK03484.1 hypothetical protein ASPACDRAFT_49652 [Aspergillus aculeatus ATCC 16872]